LPKALLTLADARGYLPASTLLIKRIAAGAGDLVCRVGQVVIINGRAVARAKIADVHGRPLPRWGGCMQLAASQIFVLSAEPDSFDGRYIGAIDRRHVLGTALPLWLRPV
jgi:type IV secretory pathway protease TraF